MKEAYFIRHGNANYLEGCLTPRGISQRDSLVRTLEPLLPVGVLYALVSSSSPRVAETAEPFIDLIRRKTGQKLDLIPERCLGEREALGSFETLLANGVRNLGLMDKYKDVDVPLFFSHEKIIAPTTIALAEKLGIPLPNVLKLIEDKIDDAQLIDMVMKRHKCSREEVDEICKKHYQWNPMREFPYIAEASAIHFDFVGKQVKYILVE